MELSTYIVYFGLMIFVVTLGVLAQKQYIWGDKLRTNKQQIAYMLLVMAVSLAFVSAIRFQVGVDWEGYVESYNNLRFLGSDRSILEVWEFGFSMINRFFSYLDMGYQWMFFVVAIVGWLAYLKAIPVLVLPLALYFTFTGEVYFWSNNAVRQFVAAAFLLYSFQFIYERNVIKYSLSIFIGTLFHISVILFLPLYYVCAKFPKNKYFYPIVVVSSFIIGQTKIYITLLSFVESQFLNLASFLGYAGYFSRLQDVQLPEVGLGFYWILLTNLIVVIVIPWSKSKLLPLHPYLAAFTIGVVLFNLLYVSHFVGRITSTLLIFKPMLLAYTFKLVPNHALGLWYKGFLIFGYCLILITAIEKGSHQCCPYNWML